jgi:hypothetical protein
VYNWAGHRSQDTASWSKWQEIHAVQTLTLESSSVGSEASLSDLQILAELYSMGTYSDLALLMASHPDVMIIRKFAHLNAKNLLYYEAELACLEHELEAIELEDRHCGETPRQDYATSWATMAASGDDGNESATTSREQGLGRRDMLQWQTFLKIREQLCKYSEQTRHVEGR